MSRRAGDGLAARRRPGRRPPSGARRRPTGRRRPSRPRAARTSSASWRSSTTSGSSSRSARSAGTRPSGRSRPSATTRPTPRPAVRPRGGGRRSAPYTPRRDLPPQPAEHVHRPPDPADAGGGAPAGHGPRVDPGCAARPPLARRVNRALPARSTQPASDPGRPRADHPRLPLAPRAEPTGTAPLTRPASAPRHAAGPHAGAGCGPRRPAPAPACRRLTLAHDRRTRLLRGPRRRARSRRRRDQARLPQARPAVAPGRQQGCRGAGALQGDQRGLPGPLRPAAPPAVRHVRPGGRERGSRRRRTRSARPASAASRTSSTRSSAARRPAPRAVPARPRAPTSATTSGSRSRRRSSGPRRRSSSRSSGRCDTCGGSGAKAGLHAGPVPAVQRPRRGPLGPPDDAGPDGERRPRARAAGARARSSSSPARRAGARAAPSGRRSLRVTIPAGIDEGHQIRLTNEGEVGPRGGAPGSLYVAVHVADHPTLHARGDRAYLRGRPVDRAGGAGHEAPRADGGRRGRRGRDQDRAPSPGTEIRLRRPRRAAPAPAVRARRPPRHRQRRRPDAGSSKRQRELLEEFAKEGGETVSAPHGLREKLGL